MDEWIFQYSIGKSHSFGAIHSAITPVHRSKNIFLMLCLPPAIPDPRRACMCPRCCGCPARGGGGFLAMRKFRKSFLPHIEGK